MPFPTLHSLMQERLLKVVKVNDNVNLVDGAYRPPVVLQAYLRI